MSDDRAFLPLLDEAHRRARSYVAEVDEQPVFPAPEQLEALLELAGDLPESPSDPLEVLRLLDERGSPAAVAQMGGRYFGFVNGGALPVGLAARWLADAWDQNTAHYVMSPVGAKLEEVCEGWLVDLLRLPEGSAAGFVTGTMLANLSGLAAGRNALYRRQGLDVRTEGLYGAEPLRVLVGAGAHAAVFKALSLLGMGNARVETLPTDEQGAVRAESLPSLDERTMIVLQAGNVNSGAFDSIGEICHAARGARAGGGGAWIHVDGAFGLWARASKAFDKQTVGWELADSWALDAHKTLNAPYDSGVILCRDREALTSAFEATASYFQYGPQREGMRYTPSMSKRARAVELWAILKALGRSGVEDLVDQLCSRARLFAELLEAEGFRIRNDIVFNQVLASCDDDAATQAIVEKVQRSGECWCGGSTFNGSAVIRISVCSWRTTEDDVRRSVRAFVDARVRA